MDPQIPKLPGYSVSVPVSAILAFGTLYNTGMCMLQQRVIQSAKTIYHSTFNRFNSSQQLSTITQSMLLLSCLSCAAMHGGQASWQETDSHVPERLPSAGP